MRKEGRRNNHKITKANCFVIHMYIEDIVIHMYIEKDLNSFGSYHSISTFYLAAPKKGKTKEDD
jgi:hypothetical protein